MRLARTLAVILVLAWAAHGQGTWTDLGQGHASGGGLRPLLVGTGTLKAGDPVMLALTGATANAPAVLFIATTSAPTPFKGGVLVAYPFVLVVPLMTDPSGGFLLSSTWPPGLPQGTKVYLQVAIQDQAVPLMVSLSNCVKAATPVQLPSGAIAWWPGDVDVEYSDIATDPLWPNGHDGNPFFCTPTTTDVSIIPDGMVGGAFHFNGVCQSIVDIPAIDGLIGGDSPRTVELWTNVGEVPQDPQGEGTAFHMGGQTSGPVIFDVVPMGGFGVGYALSFRSGGGEGHDFHTNIDLRDGEWHHVAVTYGPDHLLTMYSDGVAVPLYSWEFDVPLTGPLMLNTGSATASIGGVNVTSPTGSHLTGEIDEATFYNRALDAEEIKAIFEAGSAGKVKP